MAWLRHISTLGIAVTAAVACSDGTVVGGSTDGDGGGGNVPDGKSLGRSCDASDDDSGGCRAGLTCGGEGTCEFAHSGEEGTRCIAAGECAEGMQCALGSCVPAGEGDVGTGCTLDTDCKGGLRCGIVSLGAQCVPEGTADAGQSCVVSADCVAGLLCSPGPDGVGDTTCAPIPASGPTAGIPFGLPVAPGIECSETSLTGVTAYFEVPGADGTEEGGDFFRLPFPNDARLAGGKPDLTGFPTPGTALLGFDPVQIYVDAIEESEEGWGLNPTFLFRFSGQIDFDSFRAKEGEPSPVLLLDITDPKAPVNAGANWNYSSGGGKYICHNWFAVRRGQGSPLEPDHKYVAYMTTVGKDKSGNPIERSPQLEALLADEAPSDPALSAAHEAYAPFREYLAAEDVSPDDVLNAAVITTAPSRSIMAGIAKATLGAKEPAVSGWVKCGAGESPCPQAEGDRACGKGSADYDEYHALVALPIFQKGDAPYLDGGGEIDVSGGPLRTEQVCMAITVPKGTPPEGGFPVVVFGHGTGGSFRSHVSDEVAGALATSTPKIAVLGYDAVLHGPRRGDSTMDPNPLFFNFENPAAARGNPLQGAADVISMGRVAKALAIPASVAGTAVTSNPDAVIYFGHSRGSMHGSLALPYTNDYRAVVLSGHGASLTDSLLTKTSPDNLAAAVPFALGGDFDSKMKLYGGTSHPVLGLLQQWIDPADPLNFALALTRERNEGILPKSVFQTYGLGDTYSPPTTMKVYALAARLPQVTPDASVSTPDDLGIDEQPAPLSGNFADGDVTVTHGLRQYQNAEGQDGHFVVFDVESATADVVRFLSMAAAGEVPQIGE